MRFRSSLAFMIYFYNMYCFEWAVTETEHGLKETIASNRMPKKTKKEILNHVEINIMDTSAAQFMLELYNKIRSADEYEGTLLEPYGTHLELNSHFPDIHELYEADHIMSFVNDAHGNGYLIQDRDRVVYFDLSAASPVHILDKAELKLYKEEPTRRTKSKCRIEIFRLRRGNDMEDKILEPEANLTVSGDYEGWLSIQITDAANYWNRNRNENFGLYVKVIDVETGQEIDLNKYGIKGYDGPKDKQPFMIAFVNNQDGVNVKHTRSGRRAGRSTSNQPGNDECKRHPLYINYTALGWKYVIAPAGYNAYYCAGECEYSPAANVTNHAIAQGLLNLRAPDKIPKPCCSPSLLSKHQVLYTLDNKTVILKHYNDMVVESCDCF